MHDLGRPARFVNMLRVVKPTSPMSVGTWILSAYAPAAGAAAASDLTGRLPRVGRGRDRRPAARARARPWPRTPRCCVADTATPAWHDAHRELPFVFVGSAATAAGGLGMLGASPTPAGPARRLAVLGAAAELTAERLLRPPPGPGGRALPDRAIRGADAGQSGPHRRRGGRGARSVGAAGSSSLAGAALLAGSALTRFGVFEAGQASARDPKYTVGPQRERVGRGQPVAPVR